MFIFLEYKCWKHAVEGRLRKIRFKIQVYLLIYYPSKDIIILVTNLCYFLGSIYINFHHFCRYHSRLFVVLFTRPTIEPVPGAFATLTTEAKEASAAFMQLKTMVRRITEEQMTAETSKILQKLYSLDLRVAKGITVPFMICYRVSIFLFFDLKDLNRFRGCKK